MTNKANVLQEGKLHLLEQVSLFKTLNFSKDAINGVFTFILSLNRSSTLRSGSQLFGSGYP